VPAVPPPRRALHRLDDRPLAVLHRLPPRTDRQPRPHLRPRSAPHRRGPLQDLRPRPAPGRRRRPPKRFRPQHQGSPVSTTVVVTPFGLTQQLAAACVLSNIEGTIVPIGEFSGIVLNDTDVATGNEAAAAISKLAG